MSFLASRELASGLEPALLGQVQALETLPGVGWGGGEAGLGASLEGVAH